MQRLSVRLAWLCTAILSVTSIGARADSFFTSPNAFSGTWTSTGSLHDVHVQPMAVTLASGKVLLAGGLDDLNHEVASAEIFDPATGRWSRAHSMHVARWAASMTLLTSGKVLVAGGASSTRAEVYDPITGAWTLVGAMGEVRFTGTATLLQTGKVLVTGGYSNDSTTPSATTELFDPVTGKWTQAASMSRARENHSAALLQTGRVLVCGGNIDTIQGTDGGAEIYSPATNSWTIVGRMMTSRSFNSETLLADGSVLVAGGAYGNFSGVNAMAMAERYDPLSGQFFQTGDMKIAPGFLPTIGGRQLHSATLLPDGKVLAAGGSGYVNNFNQFAILGTSELYDPSTGAWSLTSDLNVARDQDAAVVLSDGRTLVAGGIAGNFHPTTTAEIFTPSSSRVGSSGGAAYYTRPILQGASRLAWYPPLWRKLSLPARSTVSINIFGRKTGKWKLTGSLNIARSAVPMTLLPDGKVLIEGGDIFGVGGVTAELFDPATGKWTMTGSMHVARFLQSAQLMHDGRVLVVGGTNGPDAWSSAEIYNPRTGRWTTARRMNSTRYRLSLFEFPDGKLIAPGGLPWDGIPRDSADVYDPASSKWMEARSLNVSRAFYIGAALPNGKVLVADGISQNSTNLTSSELYDPATNSWSFTGSTSDFAEDSMLLNNGQVLAFDESTNHSELYNSAAGVWTGTIGSMTITRNADTSTLLSDGRVLVAGGCTVLSCPTRVTENYDPASQQWTADAQMNIPRYVDAAVRLPDGRVLVAGGLDQNFKQMSTVEIYKP